MKPIPKILTSLALGAAGAVTLLPVAVNAAESYQVTTASVAYTTDAKFDPVYGTGTDDKKLTTFRLEHYGVWGYGDNYIAVDNYNGKNVGNIPTFPGAGSFGDNTSNQQLIVYVPRFSLSKLTGASLKLGFIKDIYVAYRLERASYANFSSDNLGISVDLDIPGVAFLETDLYARKDRFTGDTSDSPNLFSRTVWVAPFSIGPVKMNFSGLLFINKRKDSSGTEVFLQPDLMFPIGTTGLELGYRHEYHKYRDYSRVTPTLVAKWNF